jgi:exopolyphosphatase
MDGKLEEATTTWMKHRGLTVLGALTTFRDGSTPGKSGRGKHKREMAWFVREDIEEKANGNGAVHKSLNYDDLAARLWKGLEDNAEIKVKKHKKISLEKGGKLPQGMRVRVYDQRAADVSRKVVAPLLRNILESPTVAMPNKLEKK